MASTLSSSANVQERALAGVVARLESRQSRIGIIGLGYVGLPLAARFSEVGFAITGFDVDEEKIAALNRDNGFTKYVGRDTVHVRFETNFLATDDFARVAECDALIICVPTPLGKYHDPDIGYILDAARKIRPHLREGHIVSLESTTYPGTTEGDMLPELLRDDLKAGEDFFVVYSPEREDPGNAKFDIRRIPKVVSGMTANCLEAAKALYGPAVDYLVPVSSTRVAELTKLLENIHRGVNIGLVNEMKLVADRMDIDIFEVIKAAATKPFGFTAFYPGPGVGGHCIPVDPFYLTWKAREYGLHTRFIELAGEINQAMPDFVVEKLMHALNDEGKALKSAKVLVLGVSFKKNIDDMRQSPSLDVVERIAKKGGAVAYADPYVPRLKPGHGVTLTLESVTADAATVASHDAVVIATDHDDFDYDMILREARIIIDTRGRYPATEPKVTRG